MTRYQLSIGAMKVPTGFLGRKPNTYAVAVVRGGPRDGERLGKTEVVFNSVEPDFTRCLFLETDRHTYLPITITLYNDRNEAVLAEATYEATEVFTAPGHTVQQKAANGTKIVASIEESLKGPARGNFTLHLRGLDIKNVEPGIMGLGRSDPFFEVSRKNADHAAGVVRWNSVARSKHIDNHLNPLWEPFVLTLEELCYGDLDWPLRVTVFDYQGNGKHRVIGLFETSVSVLMSQVSVRGNADRERAFEITSEEKNKTRGLIVVLKAEAELDGIVQRKDQQRQQQQKEATPNVSSAVALPPPPVPHDFSC